MKPRMSPDVRSVKHCALFLMAVLAVGCGGVAPEELKEMPPSVVSDEGVQLPEEELLSQEEPNDVSAMAACCFVSCYDGGTNRWRGPFCNVKYGNCTNYAKYYCAQHGWPFKAAKWADVY
jgi:hypothetical protein